MRSDVTFCCRFYLVSIGLLGPDCQVEWGYKVIDKESAMGDMLLFFGFLNLEHFVDGIVETNELGWVALDYGLALSWIENSKKKIYITKFENPFIVPSIPMSWANMRNM